MGCIRFLFLSRIRALQKVCRRTQISDSSPASLLSSKPQALSSHKGRGEPRARAHHAQVGVQHRVVVGEQLLQLLREAGHVLGVAVGNLQGTGQVIAPERTGGTSQARPVSLVVRISVTGIETGTKHRLPQVQGWGPGAHLRQEHEQLSQLLAGLVRLEGEDLHMGLVVVVLLQELRTHREQRQLRTPARTPAPAPAALSSPPRCAPPRCRRWGRA